MTHKKRHQNKDKKTGPTPGQLVEGQRIVNRLRWAGPGIIYAIHGTQDAASCKQLGGGIVSTGGQAFFDVVYDNGRLSKQVPESIVRGIQWEISEEIATPAEIQEALQRALNHERETNEQAAREAEAKARERAELPAQYPQLRTVEQETKTSRHALGAKNLRTLLKQNWPEVKFSVRSQSYSGGCSITVGWTDGPLEKAVHEVSDRFQECDFDGMEDLEKFRGTVWPTIFGGAHYVSCNRRFSAAFLTAVARDLDYMVTIGKHNAIEGVDGPTQQLIYREARQRSAALPREPAVEPESSKRQDGEAPAGGGEATLTEYKGHAVIQVPLGSTGKWFAFGRKKAQAIVTHFAAIERFAAGREENR